MRIPLETAKTYRDYGLSVLPAKRKEKCPALKSWKAYQERRPTEAEVNAWFSNAHEALCIVTGKASENLEIIDFDNGGELFDPWSNLVGDRAKPLLDRLVIEQTPSGGWHVIYRCDAEVSGNMKLAQGQRNGKLTTLIETRGAGGLFLCAPTPKYELLQGDFTTIPTLTENQRDILLSSAKQLNEHWISADPEPVQRTSSSGLLPGEDFNQRGDVKALLEKHGWKYLYNKNDNDYYRRPGKDHGSCSASLKDRTFFVFSSNAAPFEPWKSYSPFAVYTLLECYGEYSLAAGELSSKGYGDPLPDNSDVDISAILTSSTKETEQKKPWREITDADVIALLEGTSLGATVKLFSAVTRPPLPLAATLPKAIVLAGCALSEKDNARSSDLNMIVEEGVTLARLRIDTAGGLASNCYIMLAAPSTSGKDIGNLLDLTAKRYGWKIASAGSAEGIADALVKTNNGLITISELQNWLDPRHWQHKATTFLTEVFNKGSFEHAFSARGHGVSTRSARFCFPSIIAHIQPEIFDIVVNKQDISSGFLGRFLFCRMPDFDGRPARIDLDKSVRELSLRIDAFRGKRGLVAIPEDYLGGLFKMFRELSHEKMYSSWKRLINEYGPKLAVMLSVADLDFSQEVVITDEVWRKTAVLLQWFFAHAERMLMGVDDGNEFTKLRERLFKKIFKAVLRFSPKGALRSDISNYAGYGSTRKERDEALAELVERGILSYADGRYFADKTPPGWG
ncbi:MAG: bifunctional DNA primase/polymerase [Victivallaceae bacterium]|nr:bifunctional DNA primase/polymerase [Victivallaceae bacterium]